MPASTSASLISLVGIRDILVRIRSADPLLWLKDLDPTPDLTPFSSVTLWMQKKYFIFNISYNLPKGTFIFSLKKFNFFYNFVLKFYLKSINYFRTNYSTSPSWTPSLLYTCQKPCTLLPNYNFSIPVYHDLNHWYPWCSKCPVLHYYIIFLSILTLE
jgi:hypothetical protein